MRAIRVAAPFAAAAVLAATSFTAPAAAGDDRPAPEQFSVETRQVQLADVTSASPYVSFTVPDCVTEIGYVLDGAAGGSSRRVGTNAFAPGGQGAVRVGTLTVMPGETLRLYPAQQGVSAQLNSDFGDAGSGGGIGFTAGGGGTGTDQDYTWPWNVHQNAGGGGGASSAITVGATPAVVAAGGGGAGGSSWNDAKNTAVGGAGDARGADGVGNAGSGGALDAGATGAGLRASEPSGNGGGGGGGGGGYRGGGGGRGTGISTQGGGAGAGGTSYLDSARAGSGTASAYGLSRDDLTPTGDGTVKIAWYGCASVLTLDGTAIDRTGDARPAAGWSAAVSASEATVQPQSPALDDAGISHVTVRGYTSGQGVRTVTVTPESRPGWVLRDWTDATLHAPPAACALGDAPDTQLPVTAVDARSFRVDVPSESWIRCAFDVVEAVPDMSVTSRALLLPAAEDAPSEVRSGDDVEFSYDIRNTGNLPLHISVSDTRNDALTCPEPSLLPGEHQRCTGTISLTRD
jgi:hypothetical protein